jgi:glycosyltransferase involved in cell wall biosynthesis
VTDHPGSRPHLLYVAWAYPPARNAGVYRALATANAFAEAGWDVTVLTADRRLFETQLGADVALERRIHPGITVRRLAFSWHRGEPDLARWSRARVTSNLGWSWLAAKTSAVDFPEPVYGGWRRTLASAAHQVHAAHPVDLVIGTANPYVDFIPGWELHRTDGVPYVLDYRDSWSLDLYHDVRAFGRHSRAGRWEARLLADAAEVWFVNEPIRAWYRREFPQHAATMQVVANGYDDDIGTAVAAARERRDLTEPLTFGYLGTVYGTIPLREMLLGWRRARELSPDVAAARLVLRGHLGHFGDPDPRTMGLLEEFAADGVTFAGPVSKTEVAETYAGFDALLLVLSGGKYVTSGKVFEYAATGLPIVSVHTADSAAVNVLTGHPDWVMTEGMSPDDIARAVIAGAEAARRTTPHTMATAREWAGRYSRTNQLAPRIRALGERVAPASEVLR